MHLDAFNVGVCKSRSIVVFSSEYWLLLGMLCAAFGFVVESSDALQLGTDSFRATCFRLRVSLLYVSILRRYGNIA